MLNRKLYFVILSSVLFISFFNIKVFADCTVQGLKKYYTDDKELNGSPPPSAIVNGVIKSSLGSSSSSNPYSFTMPAGSAVITAPIVAGYDVGYTLCYNITTCHGGLPTKAASVTVTCGSGYIDLWWHYNKEGDLDLNKAVDLNDVIKLILKILS